MKKQRLWLSRDDDGQFFGLHFNKGRKESGEWFGEAVFCANDFLKVFPKLASFKQGTIKEIESIKIKLKK